MNESIPPRILMISDEGPQAATAGGIILQRLMLRHPPDRLRIVSRKVPPAAERLPGVDYLRLEVPWTRFEQSRFNRLKRSLRAVGLVPGVPPSKIDALVGDFAPDVVLCVMQHAGYYDAAWSFAERRQLPLVVIVHDINDDFEPVLPWARKSARRRDSRFYQFASRRLCVSPEMAEYCKQAYGAEGSVLYPNRAVELTHRPFEHSRELRTSGRLTLGFAGNLGYGYGTEILRLLPVLRSAGVRLILYGREPRGPYAGLADAPDVCECRGFLPSGEAWAAIKRDCDAVWLPYPNPAGIMERLFRNHFPSKLPEYLALGMPVLVTGPEYATGAKWAQRHPAAALYDDGADPGEFKDLLEKLQGGADLREALSRGAWIAGEADFAPAKLVSEFYSHIDEAVRTRRLARSHG